MQSFRFTTGLLSTIDITFAGQFLLQCPQDIHLLCTNSGLAFNFFIIISFSFAGVFWGRNVKSTESGNLNGAIFKAL